MAEVDVRRIAIAAAARVNRASEAVLGDFMVRSLEEWIVEVEPFNGLCTPGRDTKMVPAEVSAPQSGG